MTMQTSIAMRCAAAMHYLSLSFESSLMKRVNQGKLPRTVIRYNDALLVAKDHSPRYVTTIRVCGKKTCDMYDLHPGYAYFTQDCSREFRVRWRYVGLTRGKQLAERLFQFIKRHEAWDNHANNHREYDGMFRLSYVVLLDQFNEPVQEFRMQDRGQGTYDWLQDLPPEAQWVDLLKQADEMHSEGSTEFGWDNFETGRRLWARADLIRREVAMAKSQAQVIL